MFTIEIYKRGKFETYLYAYAVPRVGDTITIRDGTYSTPIFENETVIKVEHDFTKSEESHEIQVYI